MKKLQFLAVMVVAMIIMASAAAKQPKSEPAKAVTARVVTRTVTVPVHDTIRVEKIVYKSRKTKVSSKKKQQEVAYVKTPQKYHISWKGKESIKKHEGCVLKAYKDSWGYSIGYGHFMGKTPTMTKISQWKADKLFEEDVKKTERSVNDLLVKKLDTRGYRFSQDFVDGLADLIYNCGHGNVENSQIFEDLQTKVRWHDRSKVDKDLKFLASKVKTFRVNVPGHKSRREDEANLMASR